MKHGTRFAGDKFIFDEEAYREDRLVNRPLEDITHTEVLKAQNSLSVHLTFTRERYDDFVDGYIPTLDFKIRKCGPNQFQHNFYEKGMRSPWVIPYDSAMERQQKMQCLSNDALRRLEKVSPEIFDMEMIAILNHYNEKLSH